GCFTSAGHAGVDVLVQRLDQPIDGQRCIICEVNCNNDMPMHEFPLFGSPIPVARRELESYVGRRRWTPLRRLATSLSGSRGDRTPARWDIDYGQYQPPRTLEAVWAWPGIASAMAEPAEHPDAAGARTARDVDTAALLESLSGLGWTDGRARGRLIHVIDGGREVVVERSGASVFARAVSRRPQALATLLTAAGVPCCRVEGFDPNDWDDMLRVFHSSPPPWNLRVAGRHGT